MARACRAALVAALFVCGGAGSAQAFCRLTTTMPTAGASCATGGIPLAWSRQCISYTVVPRRAGTEPPLNSVRDVVDSSFASWAAVSCNGHPLALSLQQTDALGMCARPQYNDKGPNANSIMFVTDWLSQGLPNEAFGLTLVLHDTQTGEIIDADMQLNETLGPLTICKQSCPDGSVDLQNIITHEAGHFLGLGHSEQATACMWGKASVGETSKRFLSRDDEAGLCVIYGERTSPKCTTADYVPENGFSAQCAAATTGTATSTSTRRSCSVDAPGARVPSRPYAGLTLALVGLAAGSLRRRRR